jgi:hypothetical protein
MTVDEAFEEILLLTQAETEPKLSIDELKLLTRKAKRADFAGKAPSDARWTPTFNLAYAVGLGWEMKAMKVATGYDFQSADQNFKRSQMYAQLMKVAQGWKSKAAESIHLQGSYRRNSNLPSINDGNDPWPWPWPYQEPWVDWLSWVPVNTSDL